MIDLWIDAGCNDLFGNLRENGSLKEAWVAICNDAARDLYYDLYVLHRLLLCTSENKPSKYELLDRIFRAVSLLVEYTPEELASAKAIVAEYYQKETGYQSLSITATGHAHIDLAWLWPIRETRRKGARTFATALDLMNRYPEYIFGASQPQLYDWIKKDHPKLYQRAKDRIAEGRWELQGAMWVETDTNLPGAESLVRQFLYGNRFWEKEFGQYVSFVWMPDVFGYTASLPQIMRQFGVHYFSTIKLSWNQHNRFPYSTFYWEGLDGSSVLVHMPPEGNYLSEASPNALVDCMNSMARSGQYGEALLPFGIGDGGGGPSPSHLEYLRREKHLPGLPPVSQGLIRDFFARLDKTSSYPTWKGELYLEKHQGVYTTAAKNKWYNRKIERALHDVEFLSAMAMRVAAGDYPQDELESLWKEVLLYQFHDILPGSSIDRVYEESQSRYQIMLDRTRELCQKSACQIAESVDTSGLQNPTVLFNTLSFERTVSWPTEEGAVQVTLPPMGYVAIDLAEAGEVTDLPKYDAKTRQLENKYLCATFGEDGSLVSLMDKVRQREALKAPSNLYLLYPESGDAWDFSYDYRSSPIVQASLVSAAFTMDGTTAVCTQHYQYKQSSIDVKIMLEPEGDELLFDCNVNWNKDDVMLRAQFQPNIHFTTVDCDIQFGYITRSALSNTSQEQAQYEICAHKWIEVDEHNAGFALLNDSKYGYYAKCGILDINLLRSTFNPAKEVDRGTHTFRYAIYVNGGKKDRLQTIHHAYAFNTSVLSVPTRPHKGHLPATHSFMDIGSDSVIIETVKKAEDSNAIIVRSYETMGGQTEAELNCRFAHGGQSACNMYEQEIEDGATQYRPFEIKTVSVAE